VQASSRGHLEWRTDPPAGGDIRPGQTVAVHLAWDARDFRDHELRRVLACVTVDDRLESSLGTTEAPTANDGEFQYTFHVPDNLPEGARVCGRGMVSGADRHGGLKRAVSTDHCLKVVGGTGASQRHDGAAESCPEALQGPANGSLQIQGDIPEGSEVRAGQIVQTWLLWRTADFAGDPLDQVVQCVTIDGALDLPLSTAEMPTRNDGEFVQQITIPSGLAAGTRICARGSISGTGVGGRSTSERSNDLCFKMVDVRPAPIAADAVPPSSPGGDDTCLDVLTGFPKGSLRRVTNTDATTVRPGQELEVRLIWNTDDFAVSTLRQVLDCVTVDGRLDTSLSVDDHAPANNGSFVHRFLVPSGLPAGTRLCDRGFVSGMKANGELDRQKSNDLCFTLARGVATGTVAQGQAVAGPLDAAAKKTTTAALPELPRTGVPRPELVLAFVAFAAGGSAIVATSKLSRRRKVTATPSR
jgi:hypothetical protein